MTSFYTDEELSQLGLKSYGKNVLISRKCSIYSASTISIGDNVRIDDYCLLSGKIQIGSHVHISTYNALYGGNGIIFEDYTGVSPRCTLLSASDDFSGNYLVGSIHLEDKIHVTGGPIIIKRFAHICAHALVLPNITIAEGCVIGAMSQVRRNTEPWMMYAGSPATMLKQREKNMIKLIDNNMLNKINGG